MIDVVLSDFRYWLNSNILVSSEGILTPVVGSEAI